MVVVSFLQQISTARVTGCVFPVYRRLLQKGNHCTLVCQLASLLTHTPVPKCQGNPFCSACPRMLHALPDCCAK